MYVPNCIFLDKEIDFWFSLVTRNYAGIYLNLKFRSSHFSFLVTFCNKFGYENTKILHSIFVYILQSKMDKTEKNRKENPATP